MQDSCCSTYGGTLSAGIVSDQPEEPRRYYDPVIKKVSNGFIVVIGCKTFVSKEWKEISDGLAEYWENPSEAQKKFCE